MLKRQKVGEPQPPAVKRVSELSSRHGFKSHHGYERDCKPSKSGCEGFDSHWVAAWRVMKLLRQDQLHVWLSERPACTSLVLV